MESYRVAGGVRRISGLVGFAPWILEDLTWLAECTVAPSLHAGELTWFGGHFEALLDGLPAWVAALRCD